jgi:hypothetical protein
VCRSSAKLLLVGDPHQLGVVGPGAPASAPINRDTLMTALVNDLLA